jgi:phage shock protein PspC (stress-responsive transcriptional regulator)
MSDETTQVPPPEPPTEPQPEEAGRPRLTRYRPTGMLAGVSSGLGRHFGVDPVIFRIAFGVSVFFGGFGLVAYLALALFLPDESGEALVKSSRWGLVAAIVLIGLFLVPAIGWGFWDGGHGWGFWLIIPAAVALGAYAILKDRGGPGNATGVIAAIFIAGAAVAGFFLLALAGAAVTAVGFGEVAAGLVILAGVALVLGAFSGTLRWLIIPALALATGVGVAAAADIEVDGTIGHRQYTPVRADEIPANGYDLGIGRLEVDLRQIDWGPNEVIDIEVDMGIGQATVLVPEDVCVNADVTAKSGSLMVAGERQEGFDADIDQSAPLDVTPRLDLSGELQIGELRVLNDDDREIGERHTGVDGDEGQAMREARARACTA